MPTVKSILLTRLDGLGDVVLGSSLLWGLRRRWPDASITMVVRPQFATASAILPDWLNVVALPFDAREPVAGREAQIVRGLRETAEKCRSELCVIAEHNRVWAGEILSVLSGAGQVVSFDGPAGLNVMHRQIQQMLGIHVDPSTWLRVPVDADCRELDKYRMMFSALVGDKLPLPELVVSSEARERAREVWRQLKLPDDRTVVCFPSSGDLLDRSLDAKTWVAWIDHLVRHAGRTVLLVGGETDAPAMAEVESAGLPDQVKRFLVPSGDFALLAGLLLASEAYIGSDTGPMHVAAVLGRPTLGVFGGGHRAERFLPVGPRAAALRMPMGCYGCGWLCPFETKLCVKEIPLEALFAAGDELLEQAGEHEPDRPHIIDLSPPTGIDQRLAGAAMRLHRTWLDLNHLVIEHHDNLHQHNTTVDEAIARLDDRTAEMTRQAQCRDEAIAHLSDTLAEMTRQNQNRDQAIAQVSETLSEMTEANARRDESIAHLSETLAEMTKDNTQRDEAITRLSETLAEMTRQNRRRDEAIAALAEQSAEHATAIERKTQEVEMVFRQHLEMLQQQIDDVRRRSVRVPSAVYRLWRRLLRRRGPA